MNTTNTTFVGWTSSPNGRGTYDIILTCLVTTFLCCWTSVYTNIPSPDDGVWDTLRDKLSLAVLSVLGPDFIITLALGQVSSARRSVKKFHNAGYLGWTMTHAFFADMGGFVLHAPDLEAPMSLNAEQLFYLVQEGYIEYPATTKRDILDKDKSDGLSRLLSSCQALWFIVNLVTRAVQGLCITTMEITTVSFVIILFGTTWCWKDKPSGVSTTTSLWSKVPIDDIVSKAGPRAARPYYHSPLDFVSREETAMELIWQYYNELGRKVLFTPFCRRVKTVPWNRIPGDVFLRMDFDMELVGGVFVILFGCVFFLSWNSDFPSETERIVWRVASVYMITYSAFGALWMWFSMSVLIPRSRAASGLEPSLVEASLPPHRLRLWCGKMLSIWDSVKQSFGVESVKYEEDLSSSSMKSRILEFLSRSHNISANKDPRMAVPIGFLLLTSFLCLFYCVFRVYILAEDVAGLRALPPSAYETTDWASFWPHI